MEVGVYRVPPATSFQACFGSAVDFLALFQVITNWRQPQRSLSRFASTRYRGLSENVNCVAVLRAVFPFWIYDPIFILQMNEIEVCPECYLSACQKRDNWFCEPCVGLHAAANIIFYVTHLAYTKAVESFCFVPNRVNLTHLCGPNWRASRFGLQKLYGKRTGRWTHASLGNMTGEAMLVGLQKLIL